MRYVMHYLIVYCFIYGALSFILVIEGFDASEMNLVVVVVSSTVVVVVVVVTFWLTSLVAFYPARLNLQSSRKMGPFCFTSTEARWLIRDGDGGGGGGGKWTKE